VLWDVAWNGLVDGYLHFGTNNDPILKGEAVYKKSFSDYMTLEDYQSQATHPHYKISR